MSGSRDAGPLVVYGSKISYFTGKLEAYLRYREIVYEFRPLTVRHHLWTVPRRLGGTQHPTVVLPDGRWISDTTPMIAWFERRHPETSVIPPDPVQAYLALLVEDFADEWLWRPAMHYRWSYADDRRLAGTHLARELLNVPLPLAVRRRWVTRRQIRLFTEGDGIDATTRAHAEGVYLRLLEILEPIFGDRPFLLGARPTIADIGLMGPFWRHFAHDPTPARIMATSAPQTRRWINRMRAARASELDGSSLLGGVPPDLSPLLREIGATHLEALAANAVAHRAGAREHDLTVQGTTYRAVPTSAYRVWSLEQLRARFEALPYDAAGEVRKLLDEHGCWEPLRRVAGIESGHDPAGEAPFCRVSRMVRD